MILWLSSYPKSGNTWVRLFLNSPLTKPTINRPICIVEEENNIIRVTPNTITNIDVDYIQSPRLVNWTYVVVQGKALYNNSAADAQDFSLHPSEETELVLKIINNKSNDKARDNCHDGKRVHSDVVDFLIDDIRKLL